MSGNDNRKTYYFLGRTTNTPAELVSIGCYTEHEAGEIAALNPKVHSVTDTAPWWLEGFDEQTGRMKTFFTGWEELEGLEA